MKHYIYTCGNTTYYTVYIGVAILYKLALHTVGLFLAFKTRKVQIDVLNDYKYVVAIVCGSTVVLILICVIQPLTSDIPTASALSWSCLAFPLICIYLGLTFIPKVSLK